MATVIFYEKPGCISNTRQKVLLKAAGHEVQHYNLLTQPWTVESLRLFFGERPVYQWFNLTAPLVKSGAVIPEQIDAKTALELMVREPLLIRRPLMQVEERREVGFDLELIDAWIGLHRVDETQKAIPQNFKSQDLQNCPRSYD